MNHTAHASALSGGADLAGFLVLGLLGSLAHCVGMCAPFVMLVSRRYTAPDGHHAPAAAQLWYTAGRLTTYAALGGAAGVLGGVMGFAGAWFGVQRLAAVVAGTALMAWAAGRFIAFAPQLRARGIGIGRLVRWLTARMPGHPFPLGLSLGLLPCGLLYTAVVAAVARGNLVDGATALIVFGLGTAPALLGISAADRVLSRYRGIANQLSAVFVLSMGAWYLWRGLVG